jgi:hypothetical protein
MRSSALVPALAALNLVKGSPTPTDPEEPHKRGSLPTVTASGNGINALPEMLSLLPDRDAHDV